MQGAHDVCHAVEEEVEEEAFYHPVCMCLLHLHVHAKDRSWKI